MRLVVSALMIFGLVLSGFEANQANAKIEAVKGKQYKLTKQHGPWMVMVAVFSAPPEELRTEGLSPEDAADELVYELRKKGIPAYTFRRERSLQSVETIGRGNVPQVRNYELDTEICVLAGNYQTIQDDNSLGKRTLKWIKKYQPDFLVDPELGGIFRQTPGQPGPLSGSFLTVNPMLSPEELKSRQRDPDVIRFNRQSEFSLLDNPGKYTVVVASFYGNSMTHIGNGPIGGDPKDGVGKAGLDIAEIQSWQVMKALRERQIEAYVFHDRRKSIVTIGSYDSANDPEIQNVLKTFTARWETDQQTGKPMLKTESMVLPSQNGNWLCTFDLTPKVMEVPYKN